MIMTDTADLKSEASAAAAEAPDADAAAAKPKSAPKRKVAMYMAYLGAGYHGMQRNPGLPTIEAELESALVKAGAISEQNAGSFMKIHWMRAARTDKGVSAVCQVVSAKLVITPEETFVTRVNNCLPDKIRVFGIQRATDGFDARKFCDKRKYEYILPAWVFDPQTGRGRGAPAPLPAGPPAPAAGAAAAAEGAAAAGAAAAAEGAAGAAAAAEGAAAAGAAAAAEGAAAAGTAAAAGEGGQAAADAAGVPKQEAADAAAADAAADAADGDAAGKSSSGGNGGGGSGSGDAAAATGDDSAADGDGAAAAAGGGDDDEDDTGAESAGGGLVSRREAGKSVDATASTCSLGEAKLQRLRAEIAASQARFVFGPEQLQQLNDILKQYEGTHNFHNYTIRTPATDHSANRYILSFGAEVKDIGGQPWVKLVVVGQSFMLHQIRKMVGMAIAVMRGIAPAGCVSLALDPNRDFNTPMAPELGLFLDETFYDAYNKRFGELHGPVTFEPFRADAEAFKSAVLYPHICGTDARELINALWLTGLSNGYYKFSQWARWAPVRNITAAIAAIKQQRAEDRADAEAAGGEEGKQQQQKQGKRKPGSGGGYKQQQQQQPAKQQRLERPGKHQGASPAMVVGSQETYGMKPHSDTPQAAAARRELKEMRQDQQQIIVEPADLDSLYDME